MWDRSREFGHDPPPYKGRWSIHEMTGHYEILG